MSRSKSFSALVLGGALALCASPAALGQSDAPVQYEASTAEAQAVDRGAGEPERAPARIRLKLSGVDNNEVDVGRRFKTIGKVFPYVRDQRVKVILKRDSDVIQRRKVEIERVHGRDAGRFAITSKRVIKPGTYRFRANKNETTTQEGARAASRGVDVNYPDLDPGDEGRDVRLLNKLLAKQAYVTAHGSDYGAATERAVLAYRKVNNMARTSNATPGILETLATGEGGFELRWPEGGKHVETDLSRQVMVLANNGKAKHIFHISSGAPGTPTIRGKFATYRFDAGYNSKRMYYSVYFRGGYATHGYDPVPTYPASHGCIRNPIPNSIFIYKWLDMGDIFYVYR